MVAVDGMVSFGPLAAGNLNAKIVQLQELPHLQFVAAFDAKNKFEQPFIQPHDMAEAKLDRKSVV